MKKQTIVILKESETDSSDGLFLGNHLPMTEEEADSVEEFRFMGWKLRVIEWEVFNESIILYTIKLKKI